MQSCDGYLQTLNFLARQLSHLRILRLLGQHGLSLFHLPLGSPEATVGFHQVLQLRTLFGQPHHLLVVRGDLGVGQQFADVVETLF